MSTPGLLGVLALTAADLIATWAARDDRYRLRRHHGIAHPLSEDERRIVRDHRLWEIEALPARERAKAWAAWNGGLVG